MTLRCTKNGMEVEREKPISHVPFKYDKYKGNDKLEWAVIWITVILALGAILFSCTRRDEVYAAEAWKITAYCACQKCCGKSDGITASGQKAHYGVVAGNWLKFGTKVKIEGLGVFTVQDRGAKSLFGSKSNHIKHLDVFLPTHKQALSFGVKFLEVEVL